MPRTLVGNDPAAIRAAFPRRFALKPVGTVLLRDKGDDLFAYMTVAEGSQVDSYGLPHAPIIAQELFDRKADIRATVIDDEVIAVQIMGASGLIKGDWRLTPKTDLRYEDVDLPPDIAARCIRLVANLGLTYAGVDLLLTDRGYVFLEANPNGRVRLARLARTTPRCADCAAPFARLQLFTLSCLKGSSISAGVLP